ncbi:MAG: PQQ-binding-like beta-propeller repeat protein [Tannerella sp.]|jgi:outer membrane protein assembly factor BamB|nr:PQQ-binding-like beta-propeller repeat protein [Tannerella sp.]
MNKVIIMATSIFLSTAATALAQENIQWRGIDRTGVYHESGLLKTWPDDGPQLLWHYDGLGEGHTSTAIDGELIYITGLRDGDGYIYVFDLNGKQVKSKKYGPEWDKSYNGSRGTVTVNDGKIYLVSGYGSLYCLNQSSLDIVWEKNILQEYGSKNVTWGICEAPLIIDNMVIATPGGNEHNIVALDKNTGSLLWDCPGKGDLSAYCSPLYVGDQATPLIVTMTADHIIGVEAKTGKFLWSHENKNQHGVQANTPVYSNGMILCTSGYGRGSTMLRLKDGGQSIEEVWFSKDLDNRIGAMVKVGDYVYGSGDKNRSWFCADWNTGEIKYREQGLAMGNIISNDGMLYCYTEKGDLLLVKATPDKFDVAGKLAVTLGTNQHWAHTVLYKGVMYVRHGDTLMAYKVKNG